MCGYVYIICIYSNLLSSPRERKRACMCIAKKRNVLNQENLHGKRKNGEANQGKVTAGYAVWQRHASGCWWMSQGPAHARSPYKAPLRPANPSRAFQLSAHAASLFLFSTHRDINFIISLSGFYTVCPPCSTHHHGLWQENQCCTLRQKIPVFTAASTKRHVFNQRTIYYIRTIPS